MFLFCLAVTDITASPLISQIWVCHHAQLPTEPLRRVTTLASISQYLQLVKSRTSPAICSLLQFLT
jgi:hypothetical protein